MKKFYSIESIFGGSDFYDESGSKIGYSVPGIGGGEDFFFDDGTQGYSVDSVVNGKDFYVYDGCQPSQDIYEDILNSNYGFDEPDDFLDE